jgi:hypothetical protein
MSLFREFPKLARLSRTVTISEKLNGTNAQVFIVGPEGFPDFVPDDDPLFIPPLVDTGDYRIWAGSRTRMLTPESDNFGFAKWVQRNAKELFQLGPGRHFGEWWGNGIQCGYGLKEKRFSLFNTHRWSLERDLVKYPLPPPSCVSVVPVIYRGPFSTDGVNKALEVLRIHGSLAAPGFMKPEGVVVYHEAANMAFKKTIEKDDVPKGMVA